MSDSTTALQRIQLYDNTRLEGARTCLRFFYFRHIRNWVPDSKAEPLAFGGGWGHALDVIWRRYKDLKNKKTRSEVIEEAYQAFIAKWVQEGFSHPDDMSPEDIEDMMPRTPMIAQEMLYHYIDERMHIFEAPSFELLHIERPFAVPLSPTDNSIFYVGRMDKEIRFQKQRICIEHKTTTLYKKDGFFRSDWIDSWHMTAQVDGYLYSMRMEFPTERSPAVWVDGALVHKSEHDGFKFIPVEKREDALEAWLYDTYYWVSEIMGNRSVLAERERLEAPYLAAFPRNTKSCIQYNRRCPFFDICLAKPNPGKEKEPPLGYKTERWTPFREIRLQELGFSEETAE